jgi:hypothetical protein
MSPQTPARNIALFKGVRYSEGALHPTVPHISVPHQVRTAVDVYGGLTEDAGLQTEENYEYFLRIPLQVPNPTLFRLIPDEERDTPLTCPVVFKYAELSILDASVVAKTQKIPGINTDLNGLQDNGSL